MSVSINPFEWASDARRRRGIRRLVASELSGLLGPLELAKHAEYRDLLDVLPETPVWRQHRDAVAEDRGVRWHRISAAYSTYERLRTMRSAETGADLGLDLGTQVDATRAAIDQALRSLGVRSALPVVQRLITPERD
jgi:hypothetical protein